MRDENFGFERDSRSLNSEWDLLVGRNLPWELKYQADMYDSLINLE